MEDVKKIGDRGNSRGTFEEQYPKKKGLKAAAKVEEAKSNSEAVKIGISKSQSTSKEQVYKILNEINQAVRNTDEITALVDGIVGIVTQANRAETAERLNALESEARDLAAEVAKIASLEIDSASMSENKLSAQAKKLSDSFGALSKPAQKITTELSPFSDSSKTKQYEEVVSQAKAEIESISENIRATALELKKAMELGETVVENKEASFAMVRDVESAIEMAKNTSKSINADPKTAIGAIGESKRAADLIK